MKKYYFLDNNNYKLLKYSKNYISQFYLPVDPNPLTPRFVSS